MNERTKGYLSILLHGLFIGFSFLAVKIALSYTDALDLLSYRFTVTAIALLIVGLFNKEIKALDFRTFFQILPIGIFYPILFFLFQTFGLTVTTSSEAGIIYSMSPVMTFLVAKLLIKEKTNRTKLIFMTIAILGLVFINIMDGLRLRFSNLPGALLIVLSAFSISVYNVLIKKHSSDFTPLQLTYIVSLQGFLIFGSVSLIKHLIQGDWKSYVTALTNPLLLLAVLYIGIFASLLSNLTASYSLMRLEATTVSLFQNLATVYIIISGVVFLNEKLYYYHYIGFAAVLAGTIGFSLFEKRY